MESVGGYSEVCECLTLAVAAVLRRGGRRKVAHIDQCICEYLPAISRICSTFLH